MKRKLLFVCMLLGSLSMWAQSTYPEKMYLIGDASTAGWDLGKKVLMTTQSEGVYELSVKLTAGELKFAKENANYGTPTDFYGKTGEDPVVLATSGEYAVENNAENFKVETEGVYVLRLDLTQNKLFVSEGQEYTSEPGHWIYFKNTDKKWSNVYLRIGRADHVYTKAFEPIAGTDWWRCETPDYAGYTHFTITDNADDTAPVTTYPDGANRLYEYQYDLTEDRWFILTQGPNASGTHYYWNNTSDLHEYTVYLVPEELDWQNDWTSANSVHLELNWTDIPAVQLNKEVKMSPIEEGSHIYKGTIKIPFTQIYGMNFKLYEDTTYIKTYAIYHDAYVQASEWNGKLFSHAKNDDWNQKWFDYPAPKYSVEAGHTIYFDNTKTKWAQPYLRVGRAKAHGYSGNHVHSYPFTRVGTTDIWTLTTEEYTEAEAWTISNVNQSSDENVYSAGFGVSDRQRVFYFKKSIDKDICVKVTTDGTLDHDPWDVYYWGCEITDEKPIYTRDVTNTYGTICLPYGSSNYTGATFYELVGQSAEGVYLGSVDNLEAGVPYVFEKSANQLVVIYEGEVVQDAKSKNGLIGTFDDETEVAIGNYIIANNEICKCEVECYVNANRAYINLAEVPIGAPVKMPGRKYVCMGVQGENQATQLSNIVDSTSSSYKTVENGQLIIVCGGVKYNAQGVKL